MKHTKNHLEISDDGKSAQVIFIDKEMVNITFTSKIDILSRTASLEDEGKITNEEAKEMQHQAIDADNIPWVAREEAIEDMLDMVMDNALLGGGLGRMLATALYSRPADVVWNAKEDENGNVKESCFQMCPSCGNHGTIIIVRAKTDDSERKVFVAEEISNKKEGLTALDKMKKDQVVTDDAEYQKIKKQIEETKFPTRDERNENGAEANTKKEPVVEDKAN